MGLCAVCNRSINDHWLAVLHSALARVVKLSCLMLAATALWGMTGALASVLRRLLVRRAELLRGLLVSETLHLVRRQHGGCQGQ